MTVDGHLAIVDELLALPFPERSEWTGGALSGPGHHVRVLEASQDFWESRDPEITEAAEEQIDSALQALAEVFTTRWGAPGKVDLEPYLGSTAPAPEPMAQLCLLSPQMLVWRPAAADRWVGLCVGQADAEFPIELRVAVADVAIP
ncbi:hypothetical protein [Actinomadura kijaniata]|uniref:hypothetical protein n=1 Tax=Actinomadura kijaniata TaxID=46161 RepID=UPI00082F3355|nr:hypothetical protein [Actinomadura kijaniata]